jgi:hypothetical protein
MNHDQNFKNLILDYPYQALAFFAPDEAGDGLPDAKIVPVRQEQLKERLGDRFRELDVPLLVEWPDGRREALLFVVEEQSDPQRFSIHRLAHYCIDLSDMLKTERVVPVVIFLRGGPRRRELVLGGDRHIYLSFRFLSCELATIPYEQFRESDNIVARINLPNMHVAPKRKVEAYASAMRGLVSLESDPEKQLKYFDFIDIYADLDDNERARYEREYPEEAEIMGTFSERYIQQGIEQGMERGEQLGVRKGEAKVLLTLLQLKFGDVPESVRAAIDEADAETLLRWSTRVLTATNLDEVIADDR